MTRRALSQRLTLAFALVALAAGSAAVIMVVLLAVHTL
jgi:hypothetical protein